ncbi:MAG: hypothetical protein KH135_01755 [Firmicutes bacterium]|nr:hypothetical protein [Bacillota bacterium]
MKKENLLNLVKVICLFVVYLIYSNLFQYVFDLLSIKNSIITMFAGDVFFLFMIVILYWKEVKDSLTNLDKSKKKFIFKIIKGVILLFVVNMIVGIVSEILVPMSGADDNTQSLYDLSELSFTYTLFKTLFFGVIAEELLFKQSIRSIIPNNVLFVIISSLIYAVMNVIYGDLNSPYLLTDALSYFAVSATLAIIYVKNDDNIVLVMFTKFFYNLIPMCLLIAELF